MEERLKMDRLILDSLYVCAFLSLAGGLGISCCKRSREITIDQPFRMNDGQIERAQLALDTATCCEQILQHQAERYLVLRKLLLADIAQPVPILVFFEDVNNVAAAGFFVAVLVTANGFRLLLCFYRNLFRQTEIQRLGRTGLDTEGLLVFADSIAAHGAFGGFVRNVILGNDFPWTSVNAVFATDADFLIDDDRAFFILDDCFDRTNRRTGGELAMHTTVACPQRREPLQNRRLHSYPVCAGESIEAGAVVIVPVLTSLDTVTAADAFGRIEKDASCFAVAEPRGRNQAAVLLNTLGRAFQTIAHAPM